MSKEKGRHRKATKVEKTVAKAALVGVGASVVPLTFMSGNANAATYDEWSRVAKCESNSQWNLPGGDRDSTGGLQFRVASWGDALSKLRAEGIDTSKYPALPYQATKDQQILAGEALLALQGPRAWSVTFNGGAHCGNAAGGALSTGSVFKGGPNPFGSTPLQTIANGGKAGSVTPAPKPSTPKPKPSTPTGKNSYTVVKGDFLYKIAKEQLGDSSKWKDLYELNKSVIGSNPDVIEVGMKLRLRKDVVHTVKQGDSLFQLAKSYDIPGGWKAIFEANKDVVKDANLIYPGQKLTIPGGGPAQAAPPKPTTAPTNSGYVAPLAKGTYRIGQSIVNAGGCVSRSCGGHSGLDLSANSGTQVKAIAAGTVVHSGYGGAGAAYGDHVIIKHNDGKYTLYGHLSSHNVSKGQTVAAGRWIGNVGSTGNSSGPHLHFEVRTSATAFSSGVFTDPVSYLRSHGVTL